ncbi:hypothetical protein P5G51_007470 [Virgibacillus sp. 179-BFC.A HS]|uniref:DksA C4-type domain-containing protein n=1 Tax=Tigheibacillus jepli TaxID=3035914 RepID=A0ABU5CG26_9BACI|nr:hypothetical protein [Virgibacillus sp. 179-BFC.A HS]MDY0405264.1 hypothetical protein [Virgibacillus sp. 179-BFC.A HS]
MKNTHLTEKQLEHFKQILLNMQTNLQDELAVNSKSPNDAIQEPADYSNHPADLGTEQFEQERSAGFDMIKKEQLQQVEDALKRIEEGNYGFSVVSGKPIPIERLEAEPTAKMLVDEAE